MTHKNPYVFISSAEHIIINNIVLYTVVTESISYSLFSLFSNEMFF